MSDPKTKIVSFTAAVRQFLEKPYQGGSLNISWGYWQLVATRFLTVFFTLFIFPLDWKFYRSLLSLDFHFYHLLSLARYQPEWVPLSDQHGNPVLGAASFANWAIIVFVSVVLTLVWSLTDKKRQNLIAELEWTKTIVRYRLALVLIAYGVYQLFRLQIPYPSLSSLMTNYGDLYPWKIYYQTTAISPLYSSFLGSVEILAGLLILNRRTTTMGAGLVIGFLGNVAAVNGFYDAGELSLSTLIVLMAVFLFSFDVVRLYQLLILEKKALANRLVADYSASSLTKLRSAAKISIAVFTLLLLVSAASSQANGPYKYPSQQGLKNSFGLYEVKHFVFNNDTIPHSKSDTRRWQDVVFEQWSTISVKQNRPVIIDRSSAEKLQLKDIDRNYEFAGLSGRHFYHYELNATADTLLLTNKNRNHRNETFKLAIKRPTDRYIELSGTDQAGNRIHAVLERQDRKFMMYEGRRRAAKL
ncbi:DoxX family protein [Dyadobacter luteus]|jgi:hypothetical protein|nr:DoxX family protein [Dyadobacter luteus]